MIQFNLLPDVKLEYIKARRTKHMVMLVSLIVTGVTVAITVFLFLGVNLVQKDHLGNLEEDIDTKSRQLQSEPGIDKILAVQSQLNSLNGLHDGKPAADRIGTYLAQITPNGVRNTVLNVDFAAHTMTFEGTADAIFSVNKFIDTMKFTTFQMDGQAKNAFPTVVLSSFGRSDGQGEKDAAATYQISVTFDPTIFDIKQAIKLDVPSKITTRSITERPDTSEQHDDDLAEEEH